MLRRNGNELPHNEEFAFRADQHVGLVALLDAKTRLVTLAGGQLPSDVACEDFNPFTGDTTSSGPKTYGKFCRENDGAAVDVELFVGNLSLKADPGECSTTREELCPIIPAGNQTLKLVGGGRVVAQRDVFLDPTREYLFGVDVDESLTMTIITVEALDDKSCMAAGIPPPPPEGTPSVLKFCNGLPSGIAEVTLPDGVKLKADPGRCAPTKGMPCSKMASGEATVAVSLDGKSIGEGKPDIPPGAELVLRLYLEAGERYLQLTSVPKSTTCSQYEWK